jgi:isopenicillin-N epimerase
VRKDCHELAVATQMRICDEYGLTPLSQNQFSQMVTIPLPSGDAVEITKQLYDQFKIEVPGTVVEDRPHMRVSFQVYNTAEDAQFLMDSLRKVLP